MEVKISFFKELEEYTEKSLLEKLDIDKVIFEKIEKDLLKKRILRFGKKEYTFEYVGVIFSNDLLLVILPKINTALKEVDYINLVLKTLKKYENTKKLNYENGDFFLKINNRGESQFISVVEYILRDFMEYGLFHSEKRKLKRAEGEIEWYYTLDRTIPLKIKENFIYTDTYTRKKNLDEDNFIRKLHMVILNMCSKYLKNLSELEIYKKYPVLNFEVQDDILDEEEFVFYELDRALNNEFNDRNINLISAMKIFLLKSKKFHSYQELSFYGVKKFHDVWQEICSEIYGNDIEKLDIMEKTADESTPIWTVGKNENKFWKNNQHYKPDIVIIKSENEIKLYDAKYYPIKLGKDIFENIPNLSDVSKQFMYEEILRINFPKAKIDNIFLFPISEKNLNNISGKVEMKIFLNKYIKFELLNFQEALENYIK